VHGTVCTFYFSAFTAAYSSPVKGWPGWVDLAGWLYTKTKLSEHSVHNVYFICCYLNGSDCFHISSVAVDRRWSVNGRSHSSSQSMHKMTSWSICELRSSVDHCFRCQFLSRNTAWHHIISTFIFCLTIVLFYYCHTFLQVAVCSDWYTNRSHFSTSAVSAQKINLEFLSMCICLFVCVPLAYWKNEEQILIQFYWPMAVMGYGLRTSLLEFDVGLSHIMHPSIFRNLLFVQEIWANAHEMHESL